MRSEIKIEKVFALVLFVLALATTALAAKLEQIPDTLYVNDTLSQNQALDILEGEDALQEEDIEADSVDAEMDSTSLEELKEIIEHSKTSRKKEIRTFNYNFKDGFEDHLAEKPNIVCIKDSLDKNLSCGILKRAFDPISIKVENLKPNTKYSLSLVLNLYAANLDDLQKDRVKELKKQRIKIEDISLLEKNTKKYIKQNKVSQKEDVLHKNSLDDTICQVKVYLSAETKPSENAKYHELDSFEYQAVSLKKVIHNYASPVEVKTNKNGEAYICLYAEHSRKKTSSPVFLYSFLRLRFQEI